MSAVYCFCVGMAVALFGFFGHAGEERHFLILCGTIWVVGGVVIRALRAPHAIDARRGGL